MRSLTRRFLINRLNISIVIIISIILSIAHFIVLDIEGRGLLTAPFTGYIPGGIAIPQWTFFIMTNLFITYIVGVFYERLVNQGISAYIVRYYKKRNWIKELEIAVLIGVLIFSLIYTLVSFIIGVFIIKNIGSQILSYILFSLLWIMEMIVVGEIFITLCVCIKKSLSAFFIIILCYTMVGLPHKISCYIPFGISSVDRMNYYKLDSIFEISLVFVILIGVFLITRIILYSYGKNRIFSL